MFKYYSLTQQEYTNLYHTNLVPFIQNVYNKSRDALVDVGLIIQRLPDIIA